MKNGYYTLTVFAILIISPLLALPFIIYGIYHQYKGCQTALAVFMALLAFLTAPVGDLYRHTLMYFAMGSYSFERFAATIRSDFLTQYAEFFMAKHEIAYEFLRLVYTFITYSIFNFIFNRLMEKSDCKYQEIEYFNRYLLTFLCIDFFGVVLGVRYVFGASVFTLGVYYYICEKQYIPALIFFVLSISIHYSFLYYGLLIFLFIHVKMNKLTFVIVLILGLIISGLVFAQFRDFLIGNELQGSSYFGEGKWGKGYKDKQNLEKVLFTYAKYIACLPVTLYSLKQLKKERMFQFFLTLTLLIAFTISLGSVCERITTIFFMAIPVFVLWEESRIKRTLKKKYYRAIFLSMALIYAATFYGMRNPRYHSYYQYIAAPIPIILTHQYDYSWMYQHLNYDGSGKYRDEDWEY